MATFVVGYDLNRPGQDYPQLIRALKNDFENWWHHLDSTWLIVSQTSAVQIRNHLKQFIDANDELLVVQVTKGNAAWLGFNAEGSNWLKNHL